MDWSSVLGWLNIIAFFFCLFGIISNEIHVKEVGWKHTGSETFAIGACAMFMLTGLILGVRAILGW